MASQKQAAFLVLEFLRDVQASAADDPIAGLNSGELIDSNEKKQSVEAAAELLTQAFGLSLGETELVDQYSLAPVSLPELVGAGAAARSDLQGAAVW